MTTRTARAARSLASWILFALLAACGGGGDNVAPKEQTVVLPGDPAQPAAAALQDKTAARVDKGDIVDGHLLTRLFVVFKADATVAEVNAAAQAAGASGIAFSSSKLTMLTLQVPRQASIGAMHALARQVRAQPGVAFAWPEQELKASVLPELAPGLPVAPDNLSHLLPTRFPLAWNARGAAGADCRPRSVHVYVWDKFGDVGSRPTFLDQIASPNFILDEVNASAEVSGHGYDVVSILGAAFDAQMPTGALPFQDCLVIHQIDAFGRGMFETVQRAAVAARSSGESRFILNSSLNFADVLCGPNADQVCDADTLRATPLDMLHGAIINRVFEAFVWATEIGGTDLGERMLITQAAGNIDAAPGGFLARHYGAFRTASFASPVALATRLGQLLALMNDPSLWSSANDPTLPNLEMPAGDVASMFGRLNSLGAQNLLLVGSVTDAEVFTNHQPSAFTFSGADVAAVGENIKLPDVPPVSGTSFAAPQVAGLAAYLWMLSDPIRTAPATMALTVGQIKQTARASGTGVPVIDAFAAVNSLDGFHFAVAGPERAIRRATLDVNGDGNFDHLDLLGFQGAYQLTNPNRPSVFAVRDYSRFDLNGDGFTGGITIQPFDLDVVTSPALRSVTLPIEGFEISMNEAALSDIQILCFYAYSDLYATSPINRDEALLERSRILGADHCVGARVNALLPPQISGSASLDVMVEVPASNNQFVPAPNMLVELAPTCASVSPTSGRTDGNGRLSTTVTPNAGCTSVSVAVTARADPGTQPLGSQVVTAQAAPAPLVLTGRLTYSRRATFTGDPAFSLEQSGSVIVTVDVSDREELSIRLFSVSFASSNASTGIESCVERTTFTSAAITSSFFDRGSNGQRVFDLMGFNFTGTRTDTGFAEFDSVGTFLGCIGNASDSSTSGGLALEYTKVRSGDGKLIALDFNLTEESPPTNATRSFTTQTGRLEPVN